ncbi:MAG TPA: methyltransferase domain-containing protein [Candidatus Binatia bacterium]|nr:methyltransferase domain-containing protein [Candidatus Binatia bacterium]
MSPAPASIGIVRAARRPDGWAPPGPPPSPLAGDPSLWPGPGEDLCALAGDWKILQRRDGHRWSLDDLATAWFAIETIAATGRPPARVADLGCGIGTVLLLLAWRFPAARGIGIEAQALSVGLARRSLARNGAAGRCEVRAGDLRDPAVVPEGAAFDLVTGTPPYVAPGAGAASPRPQRTPARLELHGGIEDYCRAAARLLAPGGRFVACASETAPGRLAAAADGAGLAIARRQDVVPRAGKAPLFTLIACRCADEPGTLRLEPPLVVRDRDGRRTRAALAMRAALGMPAPVASP